MVSNGAADLEMSPSPSDIHCNILAEDICSFVLRDPFTVNLALWAVLQLTWVTMLLFVQCVQISKATTTYESMRGHSDHSSRMAEVITPALTAGSTSMEGAQIASGPSGSDDHGHNHAHKEGCFGQWKKLLGLDTFVATAQSGLDRGSMQRQRNPFSRGVVTNCKDFWCDPAPVFGQRSVGDAMLDGEVINYARMYETPPRMRITRDASRSEGTHYHSVGDTDAV